MASDIDFKSIRTIQDVVNVLSVIFFNMNEIERTYYDMFLNPQELDVTFQRYNEAGVLESITLPNRAKDRQEILTGAGSPEGKQAATIGKLYLDFVAQTLYYKGVGSDATGWVELYSKSNFSESEGSYMKPDGDGSQLKDLNASNITSGLLSVERGGTGVSEITGLIKGNGSSPFSAATEGVDYLGPNTMTGVIAFYPVDLLPDGSTDAIPKGWLRCDGSPYSRDTYKRLYDIIGTTYGVGDGTNTFNVPNLYNYYIRCWDGSTSFNSVQQPQVGKHTHALSGTTGEESSHTHTAGDMNIKGQITNVWTQRSYGTGASSTSGCVSAYYSNIGTIWGTSGAMSFTNIYIDAESSNWSGATSGGSAHSHTLSGVTAENSSTEETRVLGKMLIPIIKF